MSEFYFALPRLIASWAGGNARRSEKNWSEANVVGTLIHLIVFIAAFDCLLRGRPLWLQLGLFAPFVFGLWMLWMLYLYVGVLLLGFLRRIGIMRALVDNRAQSVLISFTTTVLALLLIRAGGWSAALGWIWIAALTANLLAAALLRLRHVPE